jgi:hypothetical protein
VYIRGFFFFTVHRVKANERNKKKRKEKKRKGVLKKNHNLIILLGLIEKLF